MDGPLVAPLLAAAVFVIALLYATVGATVGHAGATGYLAAMAVAGLPPDVIRPTALSLNVVVATIATVQFARAGHFRGRLFWPLAIASVPCAAIGGAVKLPTQAFETLLGVVLLMSAARLVREAVAPRGGDDDPESSANSPFGLRWLLPLGGGIGMLSGLTGVGGGVFLTPVLAWLRAAPIRQIAAVTAPFILANSLAGIAGGLVAARPFPLASGWLVAAAAVGGLVGSQRSDCPPRRSGSSWRPCSSSRPRSCSCSDSDDLRDHAAQKRSSLRFSFCSRFDSPRISIPTTSPRALKSRITPGDTSWDSAIGESSIVR